MRNLAALCALSVLVLSAVACGSQYPGSTVAQQVKSWATTSPDPKFASAMSTLQSDLRKVHDAEESGNMGALRTVCDVLVNDALSANQNLPTPDTQLTDDLSGAYGSAVSAGQDCFCAAGGRPCRHGGGTRSALLARSSDESTAAERGFIAAQARVDLLSILSPQGR